MAQARLLTEYTDIFIPAKANFSRVTKSVRRGTDSSRSSTASVSQKKICTAPSVNITKQNGGDIRLAAVVSHDIEISRGGDVGARASLLSVSS